METPEWQSSLRTNEYFIQFGEFKVWVHKHISDPEQKLWFTSIEPFFQARMLETEDLKEAKKKAIELLKAILMTALVDLNDHETCYRDS